MGLPRRGDALQLKTSERTPTSARLLSRLPLPLKFRASQPASPSLPESRSWSRCRPQRSPKVAMRRGLEPRSQACGRRLFPAACAAPQWTERCREWRRPRWALFWKGLRGGCQRFRGAVSPVCAVPRSYPCRRDRAAPHHLPRLAALLVNTRRHDLTVPRAGPKSTVSWESGHTGGTRDTPTRGAGRARVWSVMGSPEGSLPLHLSVHLWTTPVAVQVV